MPQPRTAPAARPAMMATRAPLLAAAAALLLALSSPSARAQSGSLDPTFSGDGIVVTPVAAGILDDFGQAVAIQDDDRIVVAGYAMTAATADDFAVVRYLLDGSLDTSFGGTGKVVVPVGDTTTIDRAFAVAIQPDQKIVVAGSSRPGGTDVFAVARLLPDGSLDTSFDGDGKVTTILGAAASEDQAYAVAVDDDGRILVAGYSKVGSQLDLAVVRYLESGALDTSFSGDGKLVLPLGSANEEARAIALQGDGKILLGGYDSEGSGSTDDMFVARLTEAGALDGTFAGGTGYVRIHFGSGQDRGYAIALQQDGHVLIAGDASVGSQTHFGVARVDENGVLDGTFDGDGRVTTAIGNPSRARALGLFESGRLVVGGFATVSGDVVFALTRYHGDGSLDTNFSGDGIVTTSIAANHDEGQGVAIQRDRKIVLAGWSRTGNDDSFAVTRYLLDDCGNGLVDVGEQCDGGAAIGGDCCTNTCQLVGAGTSCRPAVDVCDIPESCDGASGSCPADQKLPDGDGDTVCDIVDICPDDPDPNQEDGDGDGPGDACDPCTNGIAVLKPKLKITKYTSPAGDDSFSMSGTLDFPAPVPLDPVAQGLRLLIEDANGVSLHDIDVPPGLYDPQTRTGWLPNKALTSFSFRSPVLVEGLIAKAKLSTSASKRDIVKFSASGTKGSHAVPPVALPLSATVVLDAPTAATGLCGEAAFPGPKPTPLCAFNKTGSTLTCK